MVGTVIRTTGSWATVRTDEGDVVDCKPKGTFRLRGLRSTNPVAVGDRVEVSDTFITAVLDRRNYIVRRASNLSRQSHIIAANVDLVALVVCVAHPETSTTFIDRFLATAEAYRIDTHLVVNKTDLYTDAQRERMAAIAALYTGLGYGCTFCSATTGEGLEALRAALRDKTTLLSGNSGVGKSSLLNRLVPEAKATTRPISEAHDTGLHTTTYSEMYDLPQGGRLIDTPGIKGFGTFDMEREEVGHYFREIFQAGRACRFDNCTHTHEPGCAVVEALTSGRIAPSRYKSYLSMLDDESQAKYRGSEK